MARSNELQAALFHDNWDGQYSLHTPSLIFLTLCLHLLCRVACLLLNPALTSCLWTWVEASSSEGFTASMTQSTAMHMRRGGGDNWGSFRIVSLSTWANTERARGGRETSRKAVNQLAKECWRSDSRCTITLVFRLGPCVQPFRRQLCPNIYPCSAPRCSFLELPPIETHSCHASVLFPV